MISSENYDDRSPLTWVGRFPVYLTTFLVAAHVVAMIIVSLLLALGQSVTMDSLSYSSEAVVSQFSMWQFVTYVFINRPSLWFVIEMYLLLTFGSEVEKRIGHRGFGWMYLALVLAIPIVLTGAAAFGVSSVYAGSGAVHFAIFIAFVAIYPTAQIFFGFQARWIGLILLAINSLQLLAYRDWVSLSMLWLSCACAVFMLVKSGVASTGIWDGVSDVIPRQPKEEKRPMKSAGAKSVAAADPYESIDPLLDKISKHGIHSLTKAERQRLEKARTLLLERERRR
jgi:membrane associated rhomboid family serine protease